MNDMKLAFIIFDGITWLDFFGVYDPVIRLKTMNYMPDLTWDLCSFTRTVEDNLHLQVVPNKIKTSLTDYDAIIIPGGQGTRKLIADSNYMDWIRTAGEVKYKISVCTGSLVLGAAGFLKDKTATTHFNGYGTIKQFCKEVKKERIVADGNTITAGAVSSSLDLGLYLCNLWAGKEAEIEIRKQIEYRR